VLRQAEYHRVTRIHNQISTGHLYLQLKSTTFVLGIKLPGKITMYRLILISIALLMAACATTYTPPETQAPKFERSITADSSDVIKTAKTVLINEGFQIAAVDDDALSTQMKTMRLTPDQADCGTTMGIDYLKDERTVTRVGYNILVENKSIKIVTNIEGEYLKSSVTQSITMNCISKGVLEAHLYDKIKKAM
jgi:hypothetical protein